MPSGMTSTAGVSRRAGESTSNRQGRWYLSLVRDDCAGQNYAMGPERSPLRDQDRCPSRNHSVHTDASPRHPSCLLLG